MQYVTALKVEDEHPSTSISVEAILANARKTNRIKARELAIDKTSHQNEKTNLTLNNGPRAICYDSDDHKATGRNRF